MSAERVVNLGALDPQQLMALQERTQADIERFAQSLQFFGKSSAIYHSSGMAIRELGEGKEGRCSYGNSGTIS